MNILCIDPGSTSPAFCINGTWISMAAPEIPRQPYDLVVVEGQFLGSKISKYSMQKLAFAAGWELGRHPGFKKIVLTPQVWKKVLYRNGDKVLKEVFCNRVFRDFVAGRPEIIRQIPKHKKKRQDALDALGIYQATAKMIEQGRTLDDYVYS